MERVSQVASAPVRSRSAGTTVDFVSSLNQQAMGGMRLYQFIDGKGSQTQGSRFDRRGIQQIIDQML